MSTRDENLDKAREHYETRSDRRPKQTWDENTKRWVKMEKRVDSQ